MCDSVSLTYFSLGVMDGVCALRVTVGFYVLFSCLYETAVLFFLLRVFLLARVPDKVLGCVCMYDGF